MTTRIRRLEKAYEAYEALIPDEFPHTLDRSELMRGASRHGSTITYHQQGQVITAARQTEVDGLQLAAGLIALDEQRPLVETPNIYTNKKFCRTCKAWKLKTEFSPLATTIDGKHTYCRACRAAKKRAEYQPSMRWKRG